MSGDAEPSGAVDVLHPGGVLPEKGASLDPAAAVRVDGKCFAVDGSRFAFHGVTYGTFRPRDRDGERYPTSWQTEHDFEAMAATGFTVVRTYTAPPEDVIELAGSYGLRLLSDAFFPDWRYLLGASRRDYMRVAREGRAEVKRVARRLAGDGRILALSLGCEIPADVIRWIGTRRVAALLDDLVEAVREEDSDRLVTYANYPTAEYLPLEGLDFLTFNVFLERRTDFRRYLTRLHHLAGERPLVLGEVGLDAAAAPNGELLQAGVLDWQLATAVERGVAGTCIFSWTDEWWVNENEVEGWHFGLTRANRSPRPALAVAESWNGTTVRDLADDWPTLSVVVCAHDAEDTIDECLGHLCSLDYPGLEVIVVDDGSTDATPDITRRHARARLVEIEHAGLSAARNEGFRVAAGEVVAYLDSDAYPTPEWPYYLALAMDSRTVGGVGGPNLPPVGDGAVAQQVARAPGGPVHVLVGDDRAEHLPGCNMAFWKHVLEEVGGFDPSYTSAGDDVDLCWKVSERGWELGFHPAALVWHHPRSSYRGYLRQQCGYGRSEALVEARHPHRFTTGGFARWSGRIYGPFAPSLLHQRVYRGIYGSAAYQSVYQETGHGRDLVRQIGVPVAALALPTGALAAVAPLLAVPALMAALFLTALLATEAVAVRPPVRAGARLPFRCAVALLSLAQPLVRIWGRVRERRSSRPATAALTPSLPGPVTRLSRGVLLLPEERSREELAAGVICALRRGGLRTAIASEWESYDARVLGSYVIAGELVTSSHPVGCVHVRIRRRLRLRGIALTAAFTAVAGILATPLAAAPFAVGVAAALRGMWRTGPLARKIIRRGSC